MRVFRHAKTMAAELRAKIAGRGVELSHSESLELLAHLFGARDWNTLSAAIAGPGEADTAESTAADAAGWRALMAPYYERHLSSEDRLRTQDNIASRWSRIFEEANRLHAAGAAADAPEVIELATRWIRFGHLFSGGDPELRGKYMAAYRDGLGDPEVAPHLPVGTEVLDWMAPAFAAAGEALRAARVAA